MPTLPSNSSVPLHVPATRPLPWTRRQMLAGLGASVLSYGLGGCGRRPPTQLSVTVLPDMLPGSVWRDLNRVGVRARPVQVSDRAALFSELIALADPPQSSGLGRVLAAILRQVFPPPPVPQRLSLLGADWLEPAIAIEAISPLSEADLGDRFAILPSRWQQAVERHGQRWGVPWNWGVSGIAYNRKFVKFPLSDWSDLWRPELQGKIVLPDHPREVIGLTLKSLGQSYNAPVAENAELATKLAQLHEQALSYTSKHYLQTLLVRDSWVAVGWTQDLHQASQRDRNITVVIPKSGSAIAWDLWVKPNQPALSDRSEPDAEPVLSSWFDFLLQPEVADRIVRTSMLPVSLPMGRDRLPAKLRDRPEFEPGLLDRCEFLQPLSPEVAADYLTLWRAMRSGQL
ncbi:MAG: extracellular solute-binding protein [Cyanobacteria bacterium P01_F01_bin.33]